MSNLVPLFVDKSTGNIVATNDPASTTSNLVSYIHSQPTNELVWVIPHNKDTLHFIYQVYSDTMEHVFPDHIVVDNENQISIYFGTAMSGFVHLMLFS